MSSFDFNKLGDLYPQRHISTFFDKCRSDKLVNIIMTQNRYYAILSGACASAASLFGKLSGLPTLQEWLIVRAIFFGLMILCNGGVWTLYVKALQASSSSLSATVTSAATNYLLSAISGFLIFGEVTSLLWWTGAGLILTGLILIVTDQIQDKDEMLIQARLIEKTNCP